ncbi:PIG-L family deacetylase [Candidatus Daviesbacteria bacterium]|nr:PIG-L family deacetylase [Candidatus Daviesbacteria bacterium]
MKILLIFAHPDDEAFSSAGTLIKLIKKGHQAKLVTATRGEAGQVGNPPVTTQKNLGKIRERELKNAAKVTGISEIYFLDLIDGTLHNLKVSDLVKMILPIIEKEEPDILITFDKKGVSNHKDHIAISKASTLAFEEYAKKTKKHLRLYHATIPRSHIKAYRKQNLSHEPFGKMFGTADKDITTISDISETLEQKIKALKQHKSQHQDWERWLKRAQVVDLTKEYFVLIKEKNFF